MWSRPTSSRNLAPAGPVNVPPKTSIFGSLNFDYAQPVPRPRYKKGCYTSSSGNTINILDMQQELIVDGKTIHTDLFPYTFRFSELKQLYPNDYKTLDDMRQKLKILYQITCKTKEGNNFFKDENGNGKETVWVYQSRLEESEIQKCPPSQPPRGGKTRRKKSKSRKTRR